jgi:hypothetical protein
MPGAGWQILYGQNDQLQFSNMEVHGDTDGSTCLATGSGTLDVCRIASTPISATDFAVRTDGTTSYIAAKDPTLGTVMWTKADSASCGTSAFAASTIGAYLGADMVRAAGMSSAAEPAIFGVISGQPAMQTNGVSVPFTPPSSAFALDTRFRLATMGPVMAYVTTDGQKLAQWFATPMAMPPMLLDGFGSGATSNPATAAIDGMTSWLAVTNDPGTGPGIEYASCTGPMGTGSPPSCGAVTRIGVGPLVVAPVAFAAAALGGELFVVDEEHGPGGVGVELVLRKPSGGAADLASVLNEAAVGGRVNAVLATELEAIPGGDYTDLTWTALALVSRSGSTGDQLELWTGSVRVCR